MKKMVSQLLLVSLLFVNVIMVSGCLPLIVGAAAGAGSVVYISGNLEKNFDAPVKEVHQAVLDAFKELSLIITNADLNRHSARIDAVYIDGKKIRVLIKALTEHASNIKIKVGVVGNETQSQTLLNSIESQL